MPGNATGFDFGDTSAFPQWKSECYGEDASSWVRWFEKMENTKTSMKKLFGREIYVRLAEDGSAVVCTVKYGKFFSKTNKISLNSEPAPEPAEVKAVSYRKADKGLRE